MSTTDKLAQALRTFVDCYTSSQDADPHEIGLKHRYFKEARAALAEYDASQTAGEVTADAVYKIATEAACVARNEWGEKYEETWLETDDNHPDEFIGKAVADAVLAVAFPALAQQVEKLKTDYALVAGHYRGLLEKYDTLSAENASKQAQIDSLMLEYCPDEMTELQMQNWAAHQKRCSPEDEAAINAALGKDAATAQAKQAEGGT